MSKVSNVINLAIILSDGNYHKIESLAYKLEVSKRTIRTYKNDLEIARIYIESKTGKYGGYKINIEDKRLIDSI